MDFPHDLDAEMAVLGACLCSSHATETVLGMITASDFYQPAHGQIFEGIARLHENGSAIDAVTVSAELKHMGSLDGVGGTAALIALQSNTPALGSASRYAFIVAGHSLKRQGIRIMSNGLNQFQDPTTNAGVLVDSIQSELRNIDSPVLEREPEDIDVDEFLARPKEQRAPWIVEGLIREDWRVMLVGLEGSGKSVIQTQFAACSAYGISPFVFSTIPAANVLIVDLENPADVIHERLEHVALACKTRPRYETERHAYLWHRPGGIDLRKRVDRLAFEKVLQRRRPNLVVLGPIYKAYTRLSNESDEQVAAEVQRVLDDLRTRYKFALLMEHHAPKGPAGGSRELVPFGSSLWLRWSELGFALKPEKQGFPVKELRINSYRGDRVKHRWPDRLIWSNPFYWEGKYDNSEEYF